MSVVLARGRMERRRVRWSNETDVMRHLARRWAGRLIVAARRAAAKSPLVFYVAIVAWRQLKVAYFRVRMGWVQSRMPKDEYLRVRRLFQVPLSSIARHSRLPYGWEPQQRPAAVIGGDWDEQAWAVEDWGLYRELKAVVSGELTWADTESYQDELRDWEKTGVSGGRACDREEFEQRYAEWMDLYESIRVRGVLSQRQLVRAGVRGQSLRKTDDISICIARDGEMQLCDGGHRFVFAKLAGVSEIPVWVSVRHPEWMAFRQEVAAYAKRHGGRVPQPIPHADLDNIPASSECISRYRVVKEWLGKAEGTLLDLDAGWGFYCHGLSRAGWTCTAVEASDEDWPFLDRLQRACGSDYTVCTNGLQASWCGDAVFDVALALNGLRSHLRSSQADEHLVDFLQRTSISQMYLAGVSSPGDVAGTGPLSSAGKDLAESVARLTGLKRVDSLTTPDGTVIHRLVRPVRNYRRTMP